MKKMAKVADKCWQILAIIAGISLIAITLLIIVNIIMRKFMGAPIFGATELVKYGALIGGAMALAQNEWFDGNIQMTILLEHIPVKVRRVIEIVDYAVCTVGFAFVTGLLFKQSAQKFANNERTVDLSMPIGVFNTILAIGFVFLTICVLLKFILKIHEYKTGEKLYGAARANKEEN